MLESLRPPFLGQSQGSKPRWLYARSSKTFTILVAAFAVFVDMFLYSVIVPVMPFMLQRKVGVSPENVQHWVSILLTVYGASLLTGSLFVGFWVDKLPTRRRPFLSGLLLLAASSVMLCLATSLPVILVARILQGASAAVVWTVATVIMLDRVGANELGTATGWITLARSIAVLIGPMLGGLIYAHAGYYAVFGMAFAFIFFDIVFRLVLIETRVARKWDPSIGPGQDEFEGTTAEFSENHKAQASTSVTATNAMRETMAALPPPRERSRLYRIFHHLPPTVTLLGTPRLCIALWGFFWQATMFTAFDATIPIFVYRTFGWNSAAAGLIFLAIFIPTFISPLIGWLGDKHGPRWYAAAGYLLCAPPLILLRLVQENTTRQKILLASLLACVGGFSMFFEIPLWVDIIHCVEEKVRVNPGYYGTNGASGQAYGLANFFYATGVLLGPIWGGYVYEDCGWSTMAWTFGLFSALSAIPTALFIGGNLLGKGTPQSQASPTGAQDEPAQSIPNDEGFLENSTIAEGEAEKSV